MKRCYQLIPTYLKIKIVDEIIKKITTSSRCQRALQVTKNIKHCYFYAAYIFQHGRNRE